MAQDLSVSAFGRPPMADDQIRKHRGLLMTDGDWAVILSIHAKQGDRSYNDTLNSLLTTHPKFKRERRLLDQHEVNGALPPEETP